MKKFNFFENSLLVRLGLALTLVTVLGLTSMLSAMIIAEATKGEAAAINLAGTLRMQSFRIASMLMDHTHPDYSAHGKAITASMEKLESTLTAPQLTRLFPENPREVRRAGYNVVLQEWQDTMRPMFIAHLKMFTNAPLSLREKALLSPDGAQSPFLFDAVNTFVNDVDIFVKLLEEDIESKNRLLRLIHGSGLMLTLAVMFVTVYLVQTDVLIPLRNLLHAARKITNYDLTARVQHTKPNELGQLGQAFNLMAEELSKLYENLEKRVEDKTFYLERSNRSLDLLYRSLGHLYQRPVAADTYAVLLRDFEETLGTGRGSVCLAQEGAVSSGQLDNALKQVEGDVHICRLSSCPECLSGGTAHWREIARGTRKIFVLPLKDVEGQYGVLQWAVSSDEELEAWQLQLLEALSTHMGIAIGTAQRIEQKRRWSLHEERTAIARELHDSLAQSLSYMKIQVSRLQAILDQNKAGDPAYKVLSELREGLNSAYRQLRELLSTFRLKIDGGLIEALDKAVTEFSSRGNIPIHLVTNLDGCQFSPNEEIHLLQIVRESLANIIHHAHATLAVVSVQQEHDGTVTAIIDDNGIGVAAGLTKAHHYGLTIMEERARTLQGEVMVQLRPEGGTRVHLQFMPLSAKGMPLLQAGGAA